MGHLFRSGAVLLSRQALRPCGTSPWVANSGEAVRWLKQHNHTLCSSVNVPTWELLTALGSLHQLNLEIHLPCRDESEFTTLSAHAAQQFDLNRKTTLFVPVMPPGSKAAGKALWPARDKSIIERAGVILPISVRPDGHMASLIEQARQNGKQVCDSFAVEYQRRTSPLAYKIEADRINPALAKPGGDYLVHWTRNFNSAWPTEKLIDYYRAIIESERYPRTAYDSLLNIVSTGMIRASSKNMPDRVATVSFSGRSPAAMIELICWRSRYRQMSFEPYGIGIKTETAVAIGIRPVNYYESNKGESAAHFDRCSKWLTQSRGAITDWGRESEYRHRGDLKISGIPRDQLILFCHTESEAESLARRTGIRTVPFTSP